MKSKREKVIRVRVTPEEYDRINMRFKEAGCSSMSDYIRRVSINKIIVQLDSSCFEKLIKLTGNLSNNMNQIARRVNSTNRIYDEDIQELKRKVDEVWQQHLYMQSLLQKLKR